MRRKAAGGFELPVSAADAIGLFTPEGERRWAPGWAPTYPAGEPSEAPGTLFITTHGDTETTWVITGIDRDEHTAAYARITPGRHGGTVRVRCDDRKAGRSSVFVEYDLTALSPEHSHALDRYSEEPFNAMMSQWSQAICENL